MRRVSPTALSVPTTLATLVASTLVLRERHAAAKLSRLGGAALETLLYAVDANDPVTGAHVRRVARAALVLARAAELDDHTCHSVERVALFHDIGKIHQALFDVIHDHTGLTAAERRAIRTHPRRGADVLAPLAAFYPDLPRGVLAHHERWDGTGYPLRLRGRRIPIAARVVAIADTFDAVTHQRRYRRARTLTEGRAVIAEGRGTQFDPELVDLFLSPPVFAQVVSELRDANANGRRRRRHPAARDREEGGAPDLTFRWRETAPAQRPPGRAR